MVEFRPLPPEVPCRLLCIGANKQEAIQVCEWQVSRCKPLDRPMTGAGVLFGPERNRLCGRCIASIDMTRVRELAR